MEQIPYYTTIVPGEIALYNLFDDRHIILE